MTERSLLDDDARARVDALDPTQSFIVQAPAGSGKTELLIQRYLTLLKTVEFPEEVIAITFTRKAAAEMQLRVLQALRRYQGKDIPQSPHEKLTHELAGAVLTRSEARSWNIVANPRRLRIQTLDALNASLARANPLNSPTTGARIVTGSELTTVYEAAAMATLDWLGENGPLRDTITDVLRHVDNNTWLYSSYLSQMLATRDQWLPFVGSGSLNTEDAAALREKFQRGLQQTITAHLAKTREVLLRHVDDEFVTLANYAARNLTEAGTVDDTICKLEELKALPDDKPHAIPAWLGLAELLLTRTGQVRKKVDKRQGFPPDKQGFKEKLHGFLERLADDALIAERLNKVRHLPPTQYSDEQWQVLLSLFRLLPLAVAELRRLFGERGISDHIEVALTASAALGTADQPGDIALLLDYQLKHLLVDEMQDTSAAQYRMLETLTGGWQAGDGRTLFCVGDPMQSIYRFRNAEVGQFLLAREQGIGSVPLEPLVLRRNFRSGEHLVQWFNDVFPEVMANEDDPSSGAVSYADAVPVESLAGHGRCEVHAVFGADPAQEAEQGLRVIESTLSEHPHDTMAVLVRGRNQLPKLLAKLRSRSIPYQAVEIDRLTDLPEIIDLLALTRAAAHPADRIAWLGVLRGPGIGLDWTDLKQLVQNDSGSNVWELLNDAERCSNISAAGRAAISAAWQTLEALVNPRRSQSLCDLVERTWFELGGPAMQDSVYAIDNVYRFLEVLGGLEQAGTLLDVAELEATLDVERVSSHESARLQIMTMHKAKGLQFDHVMLYGLGRQPGSGERRVLSWFDNPGEHGNEQKIISPVGARAEASNDPIHRYIELTESEKDRYEQARLLYVACTRAKQSLHLVGNCLATEDGVKPARSGSLLHLLWPTVAGDFEDAWTATAALQEGDANAAWEMPVLQRFATPWSLPDAAPIGASKTADERREIDTKVEFYWVGSNARIAGILVHRWLQQLTLRGMDSVSPASSEFSAITGRWLDEAGIRGDAAAAIQRRVGEAVAATLADERGRWALSGDGMTEFQLTGMYEGDLVSVILDRVRLDADGNHWIIDYKTSSHEGSNLDGFLKAETERYRGQLQRYAALYSGYSGAPVKCALYFPLLQSFVEVAV